MPRTLVIFVPVVKHKCMSWNGRRHGSVEKNVGTHSSRVCEVSRNVVVLVLNVSVSFHGLGLRIELSVSDLKSKVSVLFRSWTATSRLHPCILVQYSMRLYLWAGFLPACIAHW